MALREYRPQQHHLFWSPPEEVLPPDHLCFIVDEIVEQLDLGRLPDRRKTAGSPAYDPRLLVKILFYGYATGTCSSRQLMRACREQLPYTYLARQQYPDHRTISDFRKENREFLHEAFVEIVRLAGEMGLGRLGTVALDSTRLRANASRAATIMAQELERALQEAERIDQEEDARYGKDSSGDEQPEGLRTSSQRLERLRKAKERLVEKPRKTINTTDPEATFEAQGTALIPSYCAHAVVNEEGLIVDAFVRNNPADYDGLVEATGHLKQTLQEKPERLLADSGYYSIKNLELLKDQGIEGYIPSTQQARDAKDKFAPQKFAKKAFHYDPQRDVYLCPLGKELVFWRTNRKLGHRNYRGTCCEECAARKECVRGKKPYRIVCRSHQEEIMQEMHERMESEEGKRIYARRKTLVERIFGHIKYNLKFRQFLLRGRQAVESEWLLLCIGMNIRKIRAFLNRTLLSPITRRVTHSPGYLYAS